MLTNSAMQEYCCYFIHLFCPWIIKMWGAWVMQYEQWAFASILMSSSSTLLHCQMMQSFLSSSLWCKLLLKKFDTSLLTYLSISRKTPEWQWILNKKEHKRRGRRVRAAQSVYTKTNSAVELSHKVALSNQWKLSYKQVPEGVNHVEDSTAQGHRHEERMTHVYITREG